jgi:HEAT repeat protein
MSHSLELSDLLADLNHADEQTRRQAFEALTARGEAVVPALIEGFGQIRGMARLSVVRALGVIGDERAVPLLLDLMLSDDPGEYVFISSMAAKSLGQIGGLTAVEGLTAMLKQVRTGPRRMAALVLGRIGDQRAVPGLSAALHDPDPITRRLAAEALTLIGTPEALAALDGAGL